MHVMSRFYEQRIIIDLTTAFVKRHKNIRVYDVEGQRRWWRQRKQKNFPIFMGCPKF
jgi:hypothetical protein